MADLGKLVDDLSGLTVLSIVTLSTRVKSLDRLK